MYRLYDMHCHLSSTAGAETVAAEGGRRGMAFLDMGVDPADQKDAGRMHGHPNVARACGLHPWRVGEDEDGRRAAKRAAELCAGSRFVGEVGLDFSPTRCRTRSAQIDAFTSIIRACADGNVSNRVISLHAVRSSGTVLDILLSCEMPARAACVFHWFSGTGDEFSRARDAGCYFSVGPRMLATKRGREFARQAPLDRILLETDLPSPLGAPVAANDFEHALESALDGLADIRREPRVELARRIAATSRALTLLDDGLSE